MTWYKRPKLVFDAIRNLSLSPKLVAKSPLEAPNPGKFVKVVERVERIVFRTIVFSGVGLTFIAYNAEITPLSKKLHFVRMPKSLEKKLGEYKIKRPKLPTMTWYKRPKLPTMTWYKRPKLVFDVIRNLSLSPKLVAKSPLEAPNPGKFVKVVERIGRIFFGTVLFSGVGLIFIAYNTEMTPYSERLHFVLVPRSLEKKLGKYKIEKIKEEFKEYVLPLEHPQTARVRLIAKDMIESPIHDPSSIRPCSLAGKCPEYLNWEVIVIDRPDVKACCYAGKIVVFTGLLDRLESDAEIATIIGHEIGHDFARHAAVKLTQMPWLALDRLFMWCLHNHLGLNSIDHIFNHPVFKKIEREADYIGGLLMASAGYDPSIAPTVYDRLSQDMVLSDNCSVLPSGQARAVWLSRPEVMDRLMRCYNSKDAGSVKK